MEFIKSYNNEFEENLIEKYSKEFDLHKDVVKLLFARNITTKQEIADFINPPLTLFYDPFLLNNMQDVVNKINHYVKNNKKILILGDYDADGISASAILYKYFKSINVNVDVFLPNRFLDGYGLSIDTIDKVKNLYNPDLIITVDCGISCPNEIEYCKTLGIDTIVTDHHDIPEIIPNTLIINPKLPNQSYPFEELCGAGVAFKLVQALSNFDTAQKYLPIAALATVADIVPLVNENRAIVFYGLKQQDNLPIGLKMLCKKLKMPWPITSQDIAFKLAPKINASGRMGDASVSLKLYIEQDETILTKYISELIKINENRVFQTNLIYEDAIKQLENVNMSNLGAIALYSDNWESGVLGIISSKLVEKYHKPVVLLSLVDNEYKGSCRSINGINVTEVFSKLNHLLIRFGGHSQAGGLSVKPENIKEFCESFNSEIKLNYSNYLLPANKTFDIEITQAVDHKLLDDLLKLEPFGLKNEQPIFKLAFTSNIACKMKNHPNHLKLKLYNIEVLGFSMGQFYDNFNSNCKKEILIHLNKEKYKNTVQIKGLIKHVHFGGINSIKNKDFSYGYYLSQLDYLPTDKSNKINYINKTNAFNEINNLTVNSFGNLVVTYNFTLYKLAMSNLKNILNYELYNINDEKNLNTLLYAPKNISSFKNYSNVIFLDKPLSQSFINNLNNEKVYVVNGLNSLNWKDIISCEYNVFAIYHNAIKNCINRSVKGVDIKEYFDILKAENPQLLNASFAQFVFVYLVLKELNIISKIEDFKLIYNEEIKTKLNQSKIYNFFNKE